MSPAIVAVASRESRASQAVLWATRCRCKALYHGIPSSLGHARRRWTIPNSPTGWCMSTRPSRCVALYINSRRRNLSRRRSWRQEVKPKEALLGVGFWEQGEQSRATRHAIGICTEFVWILTRYVQQDNVDCDIFLPPILTFFKAMEEYYPFKHWPKARCHLCTHDACALSGWSYTVDQHCSQHVSAFGESTTQRCILVESFAVSSP